MSPWGRRQRTYCIFRGLPSTQSSDWHIEHDQRMLFELDDSSNTNKLLILNNCLRKMYLEMLRVITIITIYLVCATC